MMRSPSVRLYSLFGLLVFLNFATMGLGLPIAGEQGKLSVSNLAPILFVALAGSAYVAAAKPLSRSLLTLLGVFNVCAVVSFAVFMVRYGWRPNVLVLLFQDVEVVFAVLLLQYARKHPEEFLRVARHGIYCSAAISIVFGLQHFIFRSADFKLHGILTFGMDDKSQAAALFCCQAYILLRVSRSTFDRLVAGGLLLMSLLTLSRLPLVFMPVMMMAVATRARYGWLLISITVCALAALLAVAGDQVSDLFKIVDRLSSIASATTDDSTSAHVLLIETALQMKFSDPVAFLFGIGPGNFSQALTSFPLDLTSLEAVDPQLVIEARAGRAPMHSTPASLLLDYNIVIVFLLCFLFLRALRYLLQQRKFLDFSFVVSLFAASMFYSLHNKPYLFLAVATVAWIAAPRTTPRPEALASGAVAAPAT